MKKKNKNKSNRPSLKKFIKENGKNNVQSKNNVFEYPPIPHKNKEGLWEIINFKNYAFFNSGTNNGNHPGIIIDKINDNLVALQITHSDVTQSRNNMPLKNIIESKECPSYLVTDIKVRIRGGKGKSITINDIDSKGDYRNLTRQEEQTILKRINERPSNRKKYYEEFIKYNKNKK